MIYEDFGLMYERKWQLVRHFPLLRLQLTQIVHVPIDKKEVINYADHVKV